MRDAYYLFMNTISKLQQYIQYGSIPLEIKNPNNNSDKDQETNLDNDLEDYITNEYNIYNMIDE